MLLLPYFFFARVQDANTEKTSPSTWTLGTELDPTGLSVPRLLPDCAAAARFIESLPRANSSAEVWAPWRAYVAHVYGPLPPPGEHAVDVASFEYFGGLRLSNGTTVLSCDGFSVLKAWHVYDDAKNSVASVLVRRTGSSVTTTRSGALIEVWRDRSREPEGALYGMWAYSARGTGQWLSLGRTLVVSRKEAVAEGNLSTVIAFPSGAPTPALYYGLDVATVAKAEASFAKTQHSSRLDGRLWDTLCVFIPLSNQGLLSHAVALRRFHGKVFIGRGYDRHYAECSRAKQMAGALASAKGQVALLPALDGVVALNAHLQGFDSVQITDGKRKQHVEVVCSRAECLFAHQNGRTMLSPHAGTAGPSPSLPSSSRLNKRCLPHGILHAGPPGAQRSCCCSEHDECSCEAAKAAAASSRAAVALEMTNGTLQGHRFWSRLHGQTCTSAERTARHEALEKGAMYCYLIPPQFQPLVVRA